MAKDSNPLPFKIETGAPPPAIQRMIGGAASPFTVVMKQLGAPKGDKIEQFFVPTSVPASITDAAEREKAGKEEARKISNRISGIARRITKDDPKYAFALRTMVENGVVGVRVYRVEPAKPKPAAAPKAA